jgi:hypothetical protein
LNPDANINKTGYTCLRMGIIGGSPVSLNNYINLFAYNHASEPAPQLVITYTLAGGSSKVKSLGMMGCG